MSRRRLLLFSCVCTLLGSPAIGQEKPHRPNLDAPAAATESPERASLERQFQQTLSGAVFVGRYSIEGQQNEKVPQEEKYTILRAAKLQGDVWLLTARIQFGDQDVVVPLPLQVKWAGDTPVISVTDVTIPGLGTFTARVMIFRGRYAGTWQHGDVGGHLWGRIEKAKTKSRNQGE